MTAKRLTLKQRTISEMLADAAEAASRAETLAVSYRTDLCAQRVAARHLADACRCILTRLDAGETAEAEARLTYLLSGLIELSDGSPVSAETWARRAQ